MSSVRADTVRVYPAPEGETLSSDYVVTVAGQRVPVYTARVAVADRATRFKAVADTVNPGSVYAEAPFASFDLDGPADVIVETHQAIQSVRVLPATAATVRIDGKNLHLHLKGPAYFAVEIDGDWVGALQIFADPMESESVRPDDPNVIYFGPGIHEVEDVHVGSGKTVYIAGGAVVRARHTEGKKGGAAFSLDGDHIVLRGRGIIDGSLCPRHTANLVRIHGHDITLEGVILRDSSTWTVPIRASEHVAVRNLKLFGYRGNSDGIDVCNSRDVEIAWCYLRTMDDLVVVKTPELGQGSTERVTVKQCVLWNEIAHALSLGAELREPVKDVVFEDCDVIYDRGREWTFRIYHCDAAPISGIVFKNLRVEESDRLISLWIGKAIWSKDADRGHIRDVSFENISARSGKMLVELKGFDPTHVVEEVRFKNIALSGRPLQEADVKKNEFVHDVHFAP